MNICENIATKEEISRNQQLLLLSQRFKKWYFVTYSSTVKRKKQATQDQKTDKDLLLWTKCPTSKHYTYFLAANLDSPTFCGQCRSRPACIDCAFLILDLHYPMCKYFCSEKN